MTRISPPKFLPVHGLIAILLLSLIVLPALSDTAILLSGTSGADNPAISGSTVVFERGGNIVMYNRSSGDEVVFQSGHSTLPDTYGSRVVWQENEVNPAIRDIANSDIYLFDQSTGSVAPLVSNPWAQKEPKIYGDRVVWTDYRNYNGDIYLYNIATGKETPVCTDPAEQWSPRIYGNTIVWLDARNGQGNANNIPYTETAADIYLYDIGTGTTRRLTPVAPATSVSSPVISGNNIVWVGYENNNHPRFFWYSLPSGRTTLLPAGSGDLLSPTLSGDTLVWKEIHTSYYAPERNPCPTEMMGMCPVETMGIRYSNTYQAYDLSRNITKALGGQGTGMGGYMYSLQVYNNTVVYAGGSYGDGIAIDTISWDNTSPPAPGQVSPSQTTTIPIKKSPAPALSDATAAQGWTRRGTYLISKGQNDDAIAAFDISLAIDNRSAGAWAGKGLAHLAVYKNNDAMLYEAKNAADAFGQAVALEPGNADYWNSKGLAHYYYEEYGPAGESFNRALAINPGLTDTWYNMGRVQESTGRYNDAIISYSKVLADNPGDADALRGLNRVRAVLNLTPLTMGPTVKKTVPASPTEKTPLSPFLPVLGIGVASVGFWLRRRC